MRLILLCVLVLTPLGCAVRSDSARFPLSPWRGAGLANVVHVKIIKGTKTFWFDGFAELDPQRFVLVGLTPAGTRGFSLVHEAGEIEYEAIPFYRLPLSPRELVSVFQMVYWPMTTLEAGRRVEESATGRVFFRKQRQTARVSWPEKSRFDGLALFESDDLRVEITTRVSEPLEAL